MDNAQTCKELSSLVQLDIDAVHAYDAAINRIDALGVKEQLSQFRDDHVRHVRELSDVIRGLGEKPPEFTRDFKGYLLQGFTSLAGVTGNEGALQAMKGNEQLTNKTYANMLTKDFTPDVKSLVQRNFADEQRHLRYIEQALAQRLWEAGASAPQHP